MLHPDELTVPDAVVARLVAEQFPPWAALPLRRVEDAGTVNAVFRLGDELCVRVPLRGGDAAQVRAGILAEAAAAQELADVSPVPAPVPVAVGDPGPGCPVPWAVQTWVPGTVATVEDPAGSDGFGDDLVRLLACWRSLDTGGRRFSGGGRGGLLPSQDDWLEECFRRSAGLLDVPRARQVWRRLRTVPRSGDDVMSHGDLVPGNVLVRGGRLAGVLDGGGFGPADPALDLVSAWHLLDPGPADRVRLGLRCSDDEWLRGMGWALAQALGLVWYYAESHPTMAATGRRTVDRVLSAAP